MALNNVTFSIAAGESVALIGPNGAGKTTLVEIAMNLRRPDTGKVLLRGLDVASNPRITATIGIQLQDTRLFSRVRIGRYLNLFSDLYGCGPVNPELLDRLDLRKHLNQRYDELSGGLRQRFSLILAMINNSDILILDEPSTGLDPIAREELWSVIDDWRRSGRTLLLTSHFMEEVERLCTRVIVLSNHRVVADGTVTSLLDEMPETITTLHAAYSRLVRQEKQH